MEKKAKVALLSSTGYGEKIKQVVNEAVESIGGIERVIKSGDVVLIKPNMVNGRGAESGDTTHPSLVEALIEMSHSAGAGEIFVGEGSGEVDTKKAFVSSRMKRAVDKLGSKGIPVKFVDLNYDKNPETNEFDAINLGSYALNPNHTYRIGHTVLTADVIISVPKLKSHPKAGITVALKNFIGIAAGGYYGFPKWSGNIEILPHKPYPGPLGPKNPSARNSMLSRTIIDLNRIASGRYPGSPKTRKHLAVVDGVIAGIYDRESGDIPLWKPIKVGAIIAGVDPVAVDTVSSQVMCYCPERIPMIVLGSEMGLGTMNDIEVVGDRVEDIRKFVPPANKWLDIADTSIPQVWLKMFSQHTRRNITRVITRVKSLASQR